MLSIIISLDDGSRSSHSTDYEKKNRRKKEYKQKCIEARTYVDQLHQTPLFTMHCVPHDGAEAIYPPVICVCVRLSTSRKRCDTYRRQQSSRLWV